MEAIMLNTRIKTISILVTALLSGCGVSSAGNSVLAKDCSPGPFLSINAPTLQVSTVAIVPTVLQTSTSFYSTTNSNTGVITATVIAGPAGVASDGIFTLANPYPGDTLVGAVATLPSSVLLASGIPALSMTGTSLASLVGLTSADFGVWAITNALASPMPANSVITYSAFAGGTLLTATMPTIGTKTYTGKLTGVLANTPVGGSDNVSGDVSLTVDFASGTINGLFTAITNVAGASTLPGTTAFSGTFADIPLSGGTISGNSLSATVTTPSITGATTTTLKGNFYGSSANELAGTFTISVPTGPGLKLIGSFGAK